MLRQLMDEFLLAGQANGWSPLTVRQYERHLAWLAGWLEEHGATTLEEVTRTLLRQWLAAQRERWSPATCKVAVTVLHSWLRFCEEEGHGGGSLVSAVKVPRVPETVQRAVDRHEVEALLHACEEPATSGLTPAQAEAARLRNAAIVAVLFDSILRASELCGLDVGDVYLERLRLAVRRKGAGGLAGGAGWVRSGGCVCAFCVHHGKHAGPTADWQRAADCDQAAGGAGRGGRSLAARVQTWGDGAGYRAGGAEPDGAAPRGMEQRGDGDGLQQDADG